MSIDNRDVFGSARVSSEYERRPLAAFVDRGEQAALIDAARVVRGLPALDVGVGAGRTAPLMELITDDYTAVDFAPLMVEAFRRVHPHLTAIEGDARDLSRFESDRFGLIFFSYNGIDTVGHDDRVQILTEFGRVVQPGGRIVFSTLNKYGNSYRESPWQLHRPGMPISAKEIVFRLGHAALHPSSVPRSVRNWRRGRQAHIDGGTWAVGCIAAHDFGPFLHFTTLADLRSTAAAAGLDVLTIYGSDGSVVDPAHSESTADNFTVVATTGATVV